MDRKLTNSIVGALVCEMSIWSVGWWVRGWMGGYVSGQLTQPGVFFIVILAYVCRHASLLVAWLIVLCAH